MKNVMVLTDDELRLVMRHRQHLEYLKQRDEKQKSCQHKWRFDGHGHNDDAFVCTECGFTEWR